MLSVEEKREEELFFFKKKLKISPNKSLIALTLPSGKRTRALNVLGPGKHDVNR